ncbi:MAG: hypothetical protein GX452_07160 [Ignavibacteriales bacterium]|jgi:hypothetical protein|nr:hypothetical protein [Ignavibacteriaceae bacterium]NLH61166.1 hypothetical protein [Ignavibacteriales bacterium]HOJ19355.1 hypothetical protein [Ignavibacteriaceae bacterium]
MKLLILFISAYFFFVPFTETMEDEITFATNNAKKGVYHGLNEIRKMKSKIDNKLIDNDKIIAQVEVTKEINGVRIESEGFYNSTSVRIILYRSLETLIKEKYIDK